MWGVVRNWKGNYFQLLLATTSMLSYLLWPCASTSFVTNVLSLSNILLDIIEKNPLNYIKTLHFSSSRTYLLKLVVHYRSVTNGKAILSLKPPWSHIYSCFRNHSWCQSEEPKVLSWGLNLKTLIRNLTSQESRTACVVYLTRRIYI